MDIHKWVMPSLKLSLLGILLITLATQKLKAVEPLTANELAQHCAVYPNQPESLDAQFCIRYIQGFIDGAVATDAQVMLNVEAEFERKETFSERAIRTRNISRDRHKRAARYAEFCIGDPIQLKEIVGTVVSTIQKRKKRAESILARAVVYGALRKNYPCKGMVTKD